MAHRPLRCGFGPAPARLWSRPVRTLSR
ncbi:hypothetical protein CPAR01_08689 [Colletotrichum paranaense]|uniref:Uncharacterized protein n=1 Tax=Colletotrichum paranaense TaxID=1914294 RepID=A0ABQ9SL01_9PEZI|nr:hypothetical protein CPAR01_08689 [Colletotrichum paranaense]